ncbi:MAG: hypothetical protein OIN85_00645, partial [Candidatus Methanoperedens sp.]|nr:hypothetical protein [Candidatus Methanoperedens sp.]
PPLGDLADSGRWSMFYRIHYGYRNSQGQMRVFQSCLVTNKESKMVEVPDAALERIDMLKAELEKAKAAGNKALETKLTELVGGQKAMYNLDSNHYLNVKDRQGNIGVLKLRHKAWLALNLAITKVRATGIEPLDVETGLYFVFSRQGRGLETTFSVTVLQESRDIPGVGKVYQDVVDALTPDDLSKLGKETAELDKLFKKPTAEEVKRIVDESDLLTGKSRAVDEILDAKSDNNSNDDGSDEEYESSPATGGSAPAASAAPANTANPALLAALGQTAGTAAAAPAAPPTGAAAAPAAAPTGAAAAPAATTQSLASSPTAAPAPTPAAKPQTTAQAVKEMSDEEFLKSLGL